MRQKICGSSILVTGGAGFIGSHLCDQLLAMNARKLVIIDNLFTGSIDNINAACKKGAIFIKDDAEVEGTLEYIIDKHNIEIVFNCATKPLNYSFINPVNAYMTNVITLKNLLELQRKKAFKTLCHFSSSEVYGSAMYEPMDEKHPFCATTTYAAGKAASDLLLFAYVQQYNLDAFIVRPFNNYGPRQNYDGPLAGIIPHTASIILHGGIPEIHGTGKQSRDFIFVEDTVTAVVRLYEKMPKGESVNISSHGQITVEELLNKIASNMGFDGDFLRLPARDADVFCHNASNEKLKGMINFEPTSFEEGLTHTLNWYKEKIEI